MSPIVDVIFKDRQKLDDALGFSDPKQILPISSQNQAPSIPSSTNNNLSIKPTLGFDNSTPKVVNTKNERKKWPEATEFNYSGNAVPTPSHMF